ncbi:MAG TPA: type II toxin-antitoxin system RelE/ParE family toxin [Pyrinomonadaceae bacterium]|nr:type II toxin-antitoxin system RelE/ParE family toxin [Chloracidobacterium sp.]HBE83862.1 type II toxin-antitoxin system RelE/ParE family toxin [Blastocatellia bacterium]HRJ87337.1 type II toxin-antitoxin system RelE/ParE family toxin [Pyrinomonadaceae bacterium]HRK51078.1 type II toxin-antitoxin system RelE/ParE family toxin [Pyrinomonadaceae bacterium]
MKRYRVVFTEESLRDIANSFEWGCQEWGEALARRWYATLRSHTRKTLMRFPLGQPLAPESDEAGREIRQLMFGRYRILYDIKEGIVRVLHVRGAFIGSDNQNLGVDE